MTTPTPPTTPPVPAPSAPEAPAAPAAQVSPEVLAYVQGQLVQSTEANSALRVQLSAAQATEAGAKAKLAEVEAQVAQLSVIALGSVNAMRVALNQPSVPAGSSAADLLAQHALAHTAYASAFPVGGVSVPPVPNAGATFNPSPASRAARVKAVF